MAHAHHGRTMGLVAHDAIKVEAVRAGGIEVAFAFPGRFLALRVAEVWDVNDVTLKHLSESELITGACEG